MGCCCSKKSKETDQTSLIGRKPSGPESEGHEETKSMTQDHVEETKGEEIKEEEVKHSEPEEEEEEVEEEEEEEKIEVPIPSIVVEKEVDCKAWYPSDDDLEDISSGQLLISVIYFKEKEDLVVTIRKGKNFPAMNHNGTCDPFINLSLFPDPQKKYKFKTQIKYKTNNPIFDEPFHFLGITEQDMQRKNVILTAFDYENVNKNQYIGEIHIALKKVNQELRVPRWIPLRKKTGNKTLVSQASSGSSLFSDTSSRKSDDAYSFAPSVASSFGGTGMSSLVKNFNYGQIHASIQYKYSKQILQIIIINAKLTKMKDNAVVNPYVKLYILPDDTKKSKQKTKVMKNTYEPMYNNTFEFKVDKELMENKKLQFTVWNRDALGKSHFLGESLIKLSTIQPNETTNKWYDLKSLSFGEIYARFSYDSPSDYLSITIIRAKDLVSQREIPDAYVKVYLLPDKKKQTKQKTRIVKQSANPEFNETIQYFLSEIENPRGRHLHISVLDSGNVGAHETIGSYSIPLQDILETQKTEATWYQLIKEKSEKKNY